MCWVAKKFVLERAQIYILISHLCPNHCLHSDCLKIRQNYRKLFHITVLAIWIFITLLAFVFWFFFCFHWIVFTMTCNKNASSYIQDIFEFMKTYESTNISKLTYLDFDLCCPFLLVIGWYSSSQQLLVSLFRCFFHALVIFNVTYSNYM